MTSALTPAMHTATMTTTDCINTLIDYLADSYSPFLHPELITAELPTIVITSEDGTRFHLTVHPATEQP